MDKLWIKCKKSPQQYSFVLLKCFFLCVDHEEEYSISFLLGLLGIYCSGVVVFSCDHELQEINGGLEKSMEKLR